VTVVVVPVWELGPGLGLEPGLEPGPGLGLELVPAGHRPPRAKLLMLELNPKLLVSFSSHPPDKILVS
jgi:hypothetical protein